MLVLAARCLQTGYVNLQSSGYGIVAVNNPQLDMVVTVNNPQMDMVVTVCKFISPWVHSNSNLQLDNRSVSKI